MDQPLRDPGTQFDTGRRSRKLTTTGIVFLVIAAAAPLTAMVGNLPMALGRGNGAGLPGAFLIATLTLICFSFGYAEISKRVVSSGAFYTYVVLGLGKSVGIAAALIAAVAYTALTIGLAAAFGFFAQLVFQGFGVDLPWGIFAATGVGVTAFMGYRSVELSSRMLAVLLVAEIIVLLWFDVSVLAARGFAALPRESLAPGVVFGPGFSIGLMFAYTSFIGFEAAALFAEESRDPKKSVSRATLVSVLFIGAFYFLTAWATIGAAGVADVAGTARQKGGEFLFSLIAQYAGEQVAVIAGVLLCTSLLAAYLALHNAATRYLFALGRERMLPRWLGEFSQKRYAPSNASVVVTILTVGSIALFFASGSDPYTTIMPSLIGLATVGIILLQALAGIAIVQYFRRQKSERNFWTTQLLPSVGTLGLILAVILAAQNFSLITSVDDPWLNWSPAIYIAIAVFGIGLAIWLRRYRPDVYAGIGAVDLRAVELDRSKPALTYIGRYCIVGAGPSGLLAARAFKLQGIPYDQFERHSDVGGIWDMGNPGTPMYESAHFISSKFTSAFFGFPMPEEFPDYPNNRQILEYIRAFAASFGLRDSIRFGLGVERAKPIGANASGGWEVQLTDGSIRHYKGIVCATGVTWHPSVPDYAGLELFQGETRHTITHRSAADLKGKRVLVVGCGNSGADIACDAARNADKAWLSVRRGYRFVPKHIFGIPTDVFVGRQMPPPKGVIVPEDVSKMLDAVVGDLTRFGLPAPDHDALQSHPIMNTQVIHHLAHGDLTAKPDVQRFTKCGALFADGTEEKFDLVLFATGYNYKIPYLDESLFEWVAGHPKLYLNIFHRSLAGLSVLGFVEFADAGYQRFDEMAQMVAMDAALEQQAERRDEWRQMKASDQPNLRGSMTYIDSPRHTNYVDVTTYRRILSAIRAQFGWFDPGHATYEALKSTNKAPEEATV